MTRIGAVITGDRDVELLLDALPHDIHEALKERISGITADLYARVEGAVPRKTGKLASEISSSVRDSEDRITGTVSVSAEFAKAAALEYGSHRTVTVSPHAERLGHVWGRLASLIVEVPEFSRRTNIDPHRFLRGPKAEMEAEIAADLQAAVDQVVASR